MGELLQIKGVHITCDGKVPLLMAAVLTGLSEQEVA